MFRVLLPNWQWFLQNQHYYGGHARLTTLLTKSKIHEHGQTGLASPHIILTPSQELAQLVILSSIFSSKTCRHPSPSTVGK